MSVTDPKIKEAHETFVRIYQTALAQILSDTLLRYEQRRMLLYLMMESVSGMKLLGPKLHRLERFSKEQTDLMQGNIDRLVAANEEMRNYETVIFKPYRRGGKSDVSSK